MTVSPYLKVVTLLGTAQTLAWASSYYLPAVLAVPMARDLEVSTPTIFAAFSFALIVSALLGPYAGHMIDRLGGRPVLATTNLLFAAGLIALANAQDIVGLFAAWLIIGIAMGSGLYEAAFAALVRLYGHASRTPITGITLFAGFASTVGWPLSTFLEHEIGWRGACYTWAALHLVGGLPLNLLLPKLGQATIDAVNPLDSTAVANEYSSEEMRSYSARATILLAIVFAATWFISTSMAAHLPRLLELHGASIAGAVAVAALVGPAQVAGRLFEFSFLRRIEPLISARLAALSPPVGAVLFALFGGPAMMLFAIMHGVGNGILTISKGTLPLVFFGAQGYGKRQGLLMVPARIAQASAPWLFGIGIDRWGIGVLWISAGVGTVAFLALMALPSPRSSGVRP